MVKKRLIGKIRGSRVRSSDFGQIGGRNPRYVLRGAAFAGDLTRLPQYARGYGGT